MVGLLKNCRGLSKIIARGNQNSRTWRNARELLNKLIKSFSSKIQPATNLNTTDRLFNKPDYSAKALSENSSSLSSDSPSIEPFQTTELDYFRKILISRRDNLLKEGDC